MNKETKIGLLVGLSFIVLFGVILNNRAPDTAPIPSRSLVPTSPRTGGTVSVRSLDLGAPPVEEIRVTAEAAHLEAPTSPPNRQAASESTEAPGTQLADAGQLAMPSLTGDSTPPEVSLPPLTMTPVVVEPVLPPPSAAEATEPAVAVATPAAGPAAEASSAKVVYTVRPGDTLTKIARLACGNGAPTSVDGIYDANKARLPNKHTLTAGQKIEIPAKLIKKDSSIEALVKTGLFERVGGSPAPLVRHEAQASAEQTARPQTAATAAPRGEVKRYQTQKGDTWYRLAEKHLGDARRWKELYQLNKDLLPDENKILPGVKIRIPAKAQSESNANLRDELAAAR